MNTIKKLEKLTNYSQIISEKLNESSESFIHDKIDKAMDCIETVYCYIMESEINNLKKITTDPEKLSKLNEIKQLLTKMKLKQAQKLSEGTGWEKSKNDPMSDSELYQRDRDENERRNVKPEKVKIEWFYDEDGESPKRKEFYNTIALFKGANKMEVMHKVDRQIDFNHGAMDFVEMKPEETDDGFQCICYIQDNHKYGHFKPRKEVDENIHLLKKRREKNLVLSDENPVSVQLINKSGTTHDNKRFDGVLKLRSHDEEQIKSKLKSINNKVIVDTRKVKMPDGELKFTYYFLNESKIPKNNPVKKNDFNKSSVHPDKKNNYKRKPKHKEELAELKHETLAKYEKLASKDQLKTLDKIGDIEHKKDTLKINPNKADRDIHNLENRLDKRERGRKLSNKKMSKIGESKIKKPSVEHTKKVKKNKVDKVVGKKISLAAGKWKKIKESVDNKPTIIKPTIIKESKESKLSVVVDTTEIDRLKLLSGL